MAPKAARGGRRGTTPAPTAASQRSRRGAPNPILAPLNDDIDRVTRAPRTRGGAGGRARRGSAARGRGGRPAAPQRGAEQQAQDGETGDSGEQQQQTGSTGQEAGAGSAQTSGPEQGTGQNATRPSTETQAPSAPVTTTGAQGDDTSATQQATNGGSQGEEGETEKEDEKEDQSKRRRSSDGSQSESPKRQKTMEGGQADEIGGQNQRQQTGERESCRRVRELLTTWASTAAPVRPEGVAYYDPVTHGECMTDDNIYRAVASVSEAVSEVGAHEFSFIDWYSFGQARNWPRDTVTQTVARPGHEMLIPWTARGHDSHLVLQRVEGGDGFIARHFDSANGDGHRRGINSHYHHIRGSLQNTNWTGLGPDGDATIPRDPEEVPVLRQRDHWTCGLHVIFYAWAFALGLRLSRDMEPGRCDQFIQDGERFVRRAVQGDLSSEAIWAFFDCYRFIQEGQRVDASRSFDATVPFWSTGTLSVRAARVRIQPHLPLGVDWDEATAIVAQRATVTDWVQVGTQDFIRQFEEQQAAIASQFERSQQDTSAEQAGGQSSGPTGTAQSGQINGGADLEQQRAILNSLHQSGTGPQPSESSGPAGQASRPNGTTTTPETPGSIIDDRAVPANFQARLDAGQGRLESGTTTNMQTNGASGGPDEQGTQLPQGSTSAAISGAGGDTAAPSTSAPTGPETAAGDPPASSSEQAAGVPATTAPLNRVPREMIPRTPEYEARQRARGAEREQARQEARQEAQRRIAAAQALAAAPGPPPPPPPPPPPVPTASGGQQTQTQGGDDGTGTTPAGEGDQDMDPFAGGLSPPEDPDYDSLFGGGEFDQDEDDAGGVDNFDDDLYDG